MSWTIDPQFIDNLQSAFHEGDEKVSDKLEESKNVQRLEKVYRIIAAKDFEALNDILDDDVTLEIIGSENTPMAGVTRGKNQVIEAVRNNFAQIDEQYEEIHSVVAQGDAVVVIGKERGRFRPTGRSYDLHWMHHYNFRNGKIVRLRELFDTAVFLDVTKPSEK